MVATGFVQVVATDFVHTVTLSAALDGLVYGDYLLLEPMMLVCKVYLQPHTLGTQHSTLDTQHSTLNPQPSTLNPHH